MIRRPPRSTLFPYRRSSDLVLLAALRSRFAGAAAAARGGRGAGAALSSLCDHRRPALRQPRRVAPARSEEHTSELQSQSNLVCRLLLEKKKEQSQPSASGAT